MYIFSSRSNLSKLTFRDPDLWICILKNTFDIKKVSKVSKKSNYCLIRNNLNNFRNLFMYCKMKPCEWELKTGPSCVISGVDPFSDDTDNHHDNFRHVSHRKKVQPISFLLCYFSRMIFSRRLMKRNIFRILSDSCGGPSHLQEDTIKKPAVGAI